MQVRNDTFYHFKTKWIAKGQQWIGKPKVPTEMCILYKVHTPLWLSSENNLCDRPPKGVYHCFMLTWHLNYTRSSHGAMTLEIDIEYSPFSALFIYEVESRTLSIPLVNCEACAHSWNVFHFTLKLQNKFFFLIGIHKSPTTQVLVILEVLCRLKKLFCSFYSFF